MELMASAHVPVAPEAVFDQLKDVDGVFALLLPARVKVSRLDRGDPVAKGSRWALEVPYAGMTRRVVAEAGEIVRPTCLVIDGTADSLGGQCRFDLAPAAKGGTDLTLKVKARALAPAGALLLFPLKAGRSSLQKRLQMKLRTLVSGMSAR